MHTLLFTCIRYFTIHKLTMFTRASNILVIRFETMIISSEEKYRIKWNTTTLFVTDEKCILGTNTFFLLFLCAAFCVQQNWEKCHFFIGIIKFVYFLFNTHSSKTKHTSNFNLNTHFFSHFSLNLFLNSHFSASLASHFIESLIYFSKWGRKKIDKINDDRMP